MVERDGYEVDAWGVGELWSSGDVVVWHELPARAGEIGGDHPLVERVRGHFRGARESFADVELDLAWCTPFQRRVVEALRSIPYGETATYGEVAALAVHPNAQRAVGSVCAADRFSLVVPCHRVVGADALGSYGSHGVGYKRRLLELEGVVL
jgi:methylated-DNA-[protein]-cysteine S-methyltransferase